MKKNNPNECDVVVIQKQTALERYTQQNLNIDFYDYLSHAEESKEYLKNAHDTHTSSRETLLRKLDRFGLKYVVFNLDELKENKIHFFHESIEKSGLQPKKKLVISLGGDGTLLHASHHIGGQVKLLGINSCPHNSVGHLCAATPDNMEEMLENIFLKQEVKYYQARRLRVAMKAHPHLPLALNDVLFSHQHPAATSRYLISLLNENKEVLLREKHSSSGVWISTAAGSTAAISSYGFPTEPLTSSKILVACREPYAANGEIKQLNRFVLDGQTQSLSLFSRMRQGLVCLDGPDFSVQFGFGESIEVSSPQGASLQIICP